MRKHSILCLLLATCLLLPLATAFAANEQPAATYSREKALEYAARRWNSDSGNCIPFASNCMQAGGLDISFTNGAFDRFFKKIDSLEAGKLYKLETIAVDPTDIKGGNGIEGGLRVVRSKNNAKIAQAGDLVFWHCSKCKDYTHVGLIGEDKNGYLSIYARNRAEGNRTPMQAWCYVHDAGEHVTVYAYHFTCAEEPREEEAAPETQKPASKPKRKKK